MHTNWHAAYLAKKPSKLEPRSLLDLQSCRINPNPHTAQKQHWSGILFTWPTGGHVTLWDPKRPFSFHTTKIGVKLSRTMSWASCTFRYYIDSSHFEPLLLKATKNLNKKHIMYIIVAPFMCSGSQTLIPMHYDRGSQLLFSQERMFSISRY